MDQGSGSRPDVHEQGVVPPGVETVGALRGLPGTPSDSAGIGFGSFQEPDVQDPAGGLGEEVPLQAVHGPPDGLGTLVLQRGGGAISHQDERGLHPEIEARWGPVPERHHPLRIIRRGGAGDDGWSPQLGGRHPEPDSSRLPGAKPQGPKVQEGLPRHSQIGTIPDRWVMVQDLVLGRVIPHHESEMFRGLGGSVEVHADDGGDALAQVRTEALPGPVEAIPGVRVREGMPALAGVESKLPEDRCEFPGVASSTQGRVQAGGVEDVLLPGMDAVHPEHHGDTGLAAEVGLLKDVGNPFDPYGAGCGEADERCQEHQAQG